MINELTREFVNYSKSQCHRGILSPIAVSVRVFILVGGIEHFIVLIGVEAMAERLRVDSDMQRRVEETEAYAYFMNMEMTDLSGLSTRADITSSSNGEKFG
jgi:hypothetical protein